MTLEECLLHGAQVQHEPATLSHVHAQGRGRAFSQEDGLHTHCMLTAIQLMPRQACVRCLLSLHTADLALVMRRCSTSRPRSITCMRRAAAGCSTWRTSCTRASRERPSS